MENNYLDIANSPIMWLTVLPAFLVIVSLIASFVKKAREVAPQVNLSKEDTKTALVTGAITAVGPSIATVIVTVSMIAVLGGPVTWIRCAIIGSAQAELSGATFAAEVMGKSIGGEGYGILEYANATWVMALNGCGWLVVCFLFTHRMEKIAEKVTKGNDKLFGAIAAAASLGAMSYMSSNQVVQGGFNMEAVFASMITMFILKQISKKYPGLAKYNLGIVILVSLFVTQTTRLNLG